MMARTTKLIALLFLFFVANLKAFAGEEPFENFIKGTLKIGDSVWVKDEKFKNSNYNWSSLTHLNVKNHLSLRIVDEQPIAQNFEAEFKLRIAYYTNPLQINPTVIDTVRLKVNYQKGVGAVYRLSDYYEFTGAHEMRVYIDEINSPQYGSTIPVTMQLTAGIHVDRLYVFEPFTPIAFSGNIINGTGNSSQAFQRLAGPTGNTANNPYLHITIPVISGAVEYDLEWTPIDEGGVYDMSLANGSMTDAMLAELFKNNATRVTLTDRNDYYISLIYNAKWIAVRVRGVDYNNTDKVRHEGDWSYNNENSPNSAKAIWDIGNNWHENQVNWQYAVSYAEEGKRKEVISYFDGSLRNRQTVTLLNETTNSADAKPLVQENIYDEFGRVVANILPAPTNLSNHLQYFAGFNKAGNNSYSYKDLNLNNCQPVPDRLNTQYGAGAYYSSLNPFRALNNFNDYIPDADGYPLSVNLYTKDNTGRIAKQGGVGNTFQPSSNVDQDRTTKYYYGKPEQWELDAIFGNDVGFADHFLKNMVIDPNGQASISYLNASGKTIATALTGNTKDNLNELSFASLEKKTGKTAGSAVALKTKHIDLLTPEKFAFDGNAIKFNASTAYVSSIIGHVKLQYDIQQLISHYTLPSNFDVSKFSYNINIEVRDDCGLLVGTAITQDIVIGNLGGASAKRVTNLQDIDLNLQKIGTYFISVTLELNRNIVQLYTEQFIKDEQLAGRMDTKKEFIIREFEKLDFSSCFNSCDATTVLGTRASFNAIFNQKLGELGVTAADYASYLHELYNTIHAAAVLFEQNCENLNPCEKRERAMLLDLSPGGQYALFDAAGNALEPAANILLTHHRIAFPESGANDELYKKNLVKMEDGTISSPFDASFSIQDIIKYWRKEWALYLLPYHPEFCKLEFCNDNLASEKWDEEQKRLDTHPNYGQTNAGNWLMAYDPFFATGGLGASFATAMNDDLNGYTDKIMNLKNHENAAIANLSTKSLVQYTLFSLYAPASSVDIAFVDTDYWNNFSAAGCFFPDREWAAYRDVYLQLKLKYLHEIRKQNHCVDACEVGASLLVPTGTSCLMDNLPEHALHLGNNTYTWTDNFQRFTQRYISGTATNPPNTTNYCGASTGYATFYSCIDVSIGSGDVVRLRNVWRVVCIEEINECESDYFISNVMLLAGGARIDIQVNGWANRECLSSYGAANVFVTYSTSWGIAKQWVGMADIDLETGTGTFFVEDFYWLGSAGVAVCGTICPTTGGEATCPPVFKEKMSHFPTPPLLSALDINKDAALTKNNTDLVTAINEDCASNVDNLIQQLTLSSAYQAASPSNQSLLYIKLVELCKKSADSKYPFASSTLAPAVAAVNVSGVDCRSFGEIIALLLLGDKNAPFTNEVNPYLTEAPYPFPAIKSEEVQTPYQPRTFYNRRHVNDAIVSNSNADICAKLTALFSAYPYPGGSIQDIYNYLASRFGSAMNISLDDLQMLVNSCNGCNFVMSRSVKLPVFLTPDVKGYISPSEYSAARTELTNMFDGSLASTSSNYETIVATYLNFKFGFSLSYDSYKTYEDFIQTNPSTTKPLCNIPAYADLEIDPNSCIKNLITLGVELGIPKYEAYLIEQKRLYTEAYIAKFGETKTTIRLSTTQKIYHYTLYYYDQAGNLIRTVPPEGVSTLSDAEQVQVQRYRESGGSACNTNGQPAGTAESTLLQQLSTTLAANGNRALEFWLYQAGGSSKQFLATTPDHKYLMQVFAGDNKVKVDIYSLNQQDPNSISIVNSNHYVANVGSLTALPWLHVVVQGNSLATGQLELWVNGELQNAVVSADAGGGTWQIGGNPLQLPLNLSALKHLRHYNRLMSGTEILSNANNNCFAPFATTYFAWHRYNVPNAGDPTTIGNTTAEVQYKNGVYPNHLLTTNYAYNSANQVIEQNTPDAGTSYFWYDFLNRLVLSQNAKQKPFYQYSYTKYEAVLGRIKEVGQKTLTVGEYNHPTNEKFRTPNFIQTLSPNNNSSEYDGFLALGTNKEITETVYDEAPSLNPGTLSNTRKRVTASIYRPTEGSTAINASYYSYDISGNVKTLYQKIEGLGTKRLDYEYDLVSGKVNLLAYQHNQVDAFYYKYNYDAENRLTEAWSALSANIDGRGFGSSLGANKRLDATYRYYLHGPLARMELGHEARKVQGVDYAYTLQGWLKGVNGTALGLNDIGGDGPQVAKDALAFSLGYYRGDYAPIGGSSSNAFAHNFQPTGTAPVPMDGAGRPLYNGNISHSTYAIAGIGSGSTTGYTYGYDQLNRLTAFRQHTLASNDWNLASATSNFKEDFAYDGMGNILTLKRHNQSGALIDDFKYNYYYQPQTGTARSIFDQTGTQPSDIKAYTNQLANVDGSATKNYEYDEIGNLIKDGTAAIQSIDWTVYGKIGKITKANPAHNISYTYDAGGNRVSKLYNSNTTYYVRDAQGNTLAVYSKNGANATQWDEQHLYGSSRLGLWRPQPSETHKGWVEGRKSYELSNHLGNVMAVINDNWDNLNGVYEPNVLTSNDYYAFGGIMEGRSLNAGNYRYGFNGKENDNDVGKGDGGQQDYGMRIYDTRIGRFLSVDPLTRQYSELTPYQFASNTPIQAIDLDGMEGAVIIGSTRQVVEVKTFNLKTKLSDRAWEAFAFIDLKQAKLSLQSHKAQGNKINVVLIQAHGLKGQFAVGAGEDGKVNTEAQLLGHVAPSDDKPITVDIIKLYIKEMKRMGEIKDKDVRERELVEFREYDDMMLVEDFLGVINEVENGGTVILNGCLVFAGNEGLDFSNSLLEITGKRINIIGPEDFVGDLPSRVDVKDRIFSGGLINNQYKNKGYKENSVNTGKNLKLNGTGKPFEFIPLNEDKKEQKKP